MVHHHLERHSILWHRIVTQQRRDDAASLKTEAQRVPDESNHRSPLAQTGSPLANTIHLRVPHEDLRQIRSLVPRRYIDLPEAMRSLLRKGLTIELRSEEAPNG
jgi:hypothetical protein